MFWLYVNGGEMQTNRKWFYVAVGLFVGVMLLQKSAEGIWAGGLLLAGGLIIIAVGFLNWGEPN